MNVAQFEKSKYAPDIEGVVKKLNSMRRDDKKPMDVSFSEFIKLKWDISLEGLFEDLGMDPSSDTMEMMVNLPSESVRWLLPEIFRDALRLGLRRAPIYPNVIASEVNISQLKVTMPHWDMSDAAPKIVGIAETIGFGNIAYGSKDVRVRKMGRGIRIPDEIRQYVSINVVALYMQDYGVKFGMGMDTMAIDTLINGEQTDGSESAPVVGVATAASFVYLDLLTVWVRMVRIGRSPDAIIGGEAAAIATLNLDEFKLKQFSGQPYKQLDLKTPVPNRTNYFIHGAVPTNKQIVIDSAATMIKLNAQPLVVEQKREVSNQTSEYYATVTTGFAILYRDGRVIIDKSLAFASGNGFPTYMDPTSQEIVDID